MEFESSTSEYRGKYHTCGWNIKGVYDFVYADNYDFYSESHNRWMSQNLKNLLKTMPLVPVEEPQNSSTDHNLHCIINI